MCIRDSVYTAIILYIIISGFFSAIFGENFCTSGQQAFKLLTNNVLRVAAINSVGDFVLFLGKVFVVATTVLVGVKVLEVRTVVFLTSVSSSFTKKYS